MSQAIILKLAASLPVGEETRRALIKMAEAPKGKLKEFLDEVGDQKVTNPDTGNDVLVRTLSKYPKDSKGYALFLAEFERWKKVPEQSSVAEWVTPETWGKAQDARRSAWSDTQVEAIKDYTSSSYANINRALRGTAPVPDHLKPDIEQLDALFQSNAGTLDTPVMVKRGIGNNHPLAQMLYKGQLKEGLSFVDPAYQSTSINKNLAWGDVKINIKVPKGARAVYVGPPPDQDSKYTNYPKENEMVLDRGTEFIVRGFDAKSRTIDVEIKPKV